MKFINTSGFDLDFVLAGKRYQVRPHETIDVPDRYAYAVAKHGLPLTPDGELPSMTGAVRKAAPVPQVIDDVDGDDPPPFSEPEPTPPGAAPPADPDVDVDVDIDAPTDEDAAAPPADEVEGGDDPGADDAEESTASDETPLDAQADASQAAAPRLTKKQRKALAAGK